jgi:hypothetical protein
MPRGEICPGLNSLLDGVTRREFDKVMALADHCKTC